MEVVPVVVGITINTGLLQKIALLRTARILRKVYWKVEGGELTQGTFAHWLWLAPLV